MGLFKWLAELFGAGKANEVVPAKAPAKKKGGAKRKAPKRKAAKRKAAPKRKAAKRKAAPKRRRR